MSRPHGQPDFSWAYAVDIAADDGRTSEQWARAAWEGAPAPLRWFMVAGWRYVLGLRLTSTRSPDDVLGWPIVERSADETVCRARSGLLVATNSFRLADRRLVWTTSVTYERGMARVVWLPASVLHRVIVRYALRRARRVRTPG